MRSVSRTRRWLKGLGNTLLALMLVWTLVPFYWMIATSLKKDREIYGFEATLIPHQPTLANYARLFAKTPFILYLRNSTIIAVGTTVASLVFGTLARFAPTEASNGRLLLRPHGRGLLDSRPVSTSLMALRIIIRMAVRMKSCAPRCSWERSMTGAPCVSFAMVSWARKVSAVEGSMPEIVST